MTTIRVHFFETTGDAYDDTQCRYDIQTGDILVCTEDQVVGLADTWPVAVTTKAGNLHQPNEGITLADLRHEYSLVKGERIFTDQQIQLARFIAGGFKWPLPT